MKRIVILFVIASLVIVTTIIWILNPGAEFKLAEITQFGIIITIAGFALFLGYKRLKSFKKGEPQEDEMSKKILQKASSLSYYISIYLWLIIMYLSDKIKYETHTLIGTGILAMAVTFGICWVIIYFTGIRNE